MTLWQSWYPLVLGHVPGCPDPVLDQALRLAAQEFCRRTRCWLVWLDPVTTLETNVEYDLDLPTNSTVVRVERATLAGAPIEIRSFRALEANPDTATDGDGGLISADRATFRLGTLVSAGQALAVQVALMPSDRATGTEDGIFRQYAEQISFGAKARLMEIPGQTWSNAALSGFNAAKFDEAIGSVAVDAWRGHTANTPRPRARWC